MKMNKKIIISFAALFSVSTIMTLAQTVNATSNYVSYNTLMHKAYGYNENGKKTNKVYSTYKSVNLEMPAIKIKNTPYYKVNDKDEYINASNIDGVQRKVIKNSYVYKTSSKRTKYNGQRKIRKGETITTYGSPVKLKNRKSYYRVGIKQYVRAVNLGKAISYTATNKNLTATATVTYSQGANVYTFDGTMPKFITSKKAGTKLVIDRAETGIRARNVERYDGRFSGDATIYRIKGSNRWIHSIDVQLNHNLPSEDYDAINNSYIQFVKDTPVYNKNGSQQDHNGEKIRKQLGQIKVDKLIYIWNPNEKKAELFYHLVGHKFASNGYDKNHYYLNVGKNAYVKASDVKFISGIKLAPSNTPQEAKAAYEASQNK